MEIQKGHSSLISKKTMVAVVIAAIISDRGLLVLPIFKHGFEKSVVQNSKTMANLWMLIITIFILHFGIQILSNLSGSKRFRDECISKPTENHNLVIVIVMIMCFELIALALHILQSISDGRLCNNFENCIENIKVQMYRVIHPNWQKVNCYNYLTNHPYD